MFLIDCDNKGCGQNTAALLDPKDGQAYCADCDRPIKNITQFAKMQLKSFRQVRVSHETYSVRCESCKTTARPKIGNKNQLVCSSCGKDTTNVAKPFEVLIRQAIEDKKMEESEDL